MRTVLRKEDRALLAVRASRLRPDSRARWGHMDAAQMLRHAALNLKMALGEVRMPSHGKRLFHTWLVKRLVIRVLPFPKGVPTSPALAVREPADFQQERDRVLELLGRFADVPRSGRAAEHPLFGVLSWQEWGELQYKHLAHHLAQFGV